MLFDLLSLRCYQIISLRSRNTDFKQLHVHKYQTALLMKIMYLIIDSSFCRCLTFVTHILNICRVMSTFLLVGQQAFSFLAISSQTVFSSPSGTWSHLLQTNIAHSGSNWCEIPFSANSSCFVNIFKSCNNFIQIDHKPNEQFLEKIIENNWPKP